MKKMLVNVLTHGDEVVGAHIADALSARYGALIGNGLDINIANVMAYKARKRYIDHDLNRSFPGNAKGSYEQRRAVELAPTISSYNIVVDVHSTESGASDMIIVTKLDGDTKNALNFLSPKYVLYMNIKPDTSLISCARVGIAFEMGSDANKETFDKTFTGIEALMTYCGLISSGHPYAEQTLYFEAYTSVPKPVGARLHADVHNFNMIKKNEVFARCADGTEITAEQDFYPVIFGDENYETIFGFAAKLLTLQS